MNDLSEIATLGGLGLERRELKEYVWSVYQYQHRMSTCIRESGSDSDRDRDRDRDRDGGRMGTGISESKGKSESESTVWRSSESKSMGIGGVIVAVLLLV